VLVKNEVSLTLGQLNPIEVLPAKNNNVTALIGSKYETHSCTTFGDEQSVRMRQRPSLVLAPFKTSAPQLCAVTHKIGTPNIHSLIEEPAGSKGRIKRRTDSIGNRAKGSGSP
jgi:hypothetical protein